MQDMKCVMCGGKILATGIELKTEQLACGIERTYHSCPHCGFKYTVMLTDKDIRELMAQRDGLKGYANIKNLEDRERNRIKFEKINKEIRTKLDKLNAK